MPAGMKTVNQKAAVTCRTRSVLHNPPENRASDTIAPRNKTSHQSDGPGPENIQPTHENHHAQSTVTTATARTATFVHQTRGLATGWASSNENVAMLNSRPNDDSARTATASPNGNTVVAASFHSFLGRSHTGTMARTRAATYAGSSSRISFARYEFIVRPSPEPLPTRKSPPASESRTGVPQDEARGVFGAIPRCCRWPSPPPRGPIAAR